MRLQRDVEQLINQNPQAFPQKPPEAAMRRLLVLAIAAMRRRAGGGADAGGRCGAAGRAWSASATTAIWAWSPRRRRRCAARSRAINIRRRSLYSNLAASKGVAPQDVGITAGCQLLARVEVGQAYMLADGQWRRRLSGQPVPLPDYCR